MISNQTATAGSAVMPRTLLEEAARGGVLLLVGLVWPALVHLIPTSVPLGPLLMPLMLPIALAALLLPLRSALLVCCAMPFISMALTGMPPLPIAFQLAAEGILLVLVTGSLIKAEKPWWLAYGAGVLACRLGAFLISILALGVNPSSAVLSVSQGFVGLLLAGLILPLLLGALKRKES